MIDVQQFRADFPEFASTSLYPSSGVQFWLNFAYKMIDSARFKDVTDMAAELFAAHHISLEARALLESKGGGIPGVAGVISAKSVDKVSINYDTGAGTEPNAGHWNITIYGLRFIRMVNMFGAGPVQLGGGCAPPYTGNAYPGPVIDSSFSF